MLRVHVLDPRELARVLDRLAAEIVEQIPND